MSKRPFPNPPPPPQQSYPPLPPGPPPNPHQQAYDYNAYWAQAARPPGQPAPPPPAPPAQTPEQAALYANYGYGNAQAHWRPPQPPQYPVAPPQSQQPQMPMFQQHLQPPQHAYQMVPIIYAPPPQHMQMQQMQQQQQQMQMQHQQVHQQQAQQHTQGQPQAVQPYGPHRPVQATLSHAQPMYTPQAPMALNHTPPHNFPPAKRPRFENNARNGLPPTPAPFGTTQFPGQPFSQGAPSTLPPSGGGIIASQQLPSQPPPPQHGKFPPQKPGFKPGPAARGGSTAVNQMPLGGGRGGSSTSFVSNSGGKGRGGGFPSKGGSNSGRGGGPGSGSSLTRGGASGGRGGSGAGRGVPRGPSYRQNQPQRFGPSGSSSSLNSNMSSAQFNPQLPNSHSFSPSFSGNRGYRNNNGSFGRDREGTPKRDDGSKKTLTDFRILGVICPSLGWSWGTVIGDAIKEDLREENKKIKEETAEVETDLLPNTSTEGAIVAPDISISDPKEEDSSHGQSSSPTETVATELGDSANNPTDITSDTTPLPPPPATTQSNIAVKPGKSTTSETSRIRLYFNSPVEPEERPTAHSDRNRGGKRKKEFDDGEAEEGGKRKKEDAETSAHLAESQPPPADGPLHTPTANPSADTSSIDNPSTNDQPETQISSGIGAKRKAETPEPEDDNDDAMTAQQESQTEYAGSQYDETDVFTASISQAETEMQDGEFGSESGAMAIDDALSAVDSTISVDEPDALIGEPAAALAAHPKDDSHLDVEAPPTETSSSPGSATVVSAAHSLSQVVISSSNESSPSISVAAARKSSTSTNLHAMAPSPNRISISYAGSSRRLVLDAEIVENVKICRAAGKIEVRFLLERVSKSAVSKPPNEQEEAESVPIVDAPPSEEVGEGQLESEHGTEDITKAESSSTEMERDPPSEQDHGGLVIEPHSAAQAVSMSGVATHDAETASQIMAPAIEESAEADRDGINGLPRCRGILIEVYSTNTQNYVPVIPSSSTDDSTLPDFASLLQDSPVSVTLTAYLDRDKPLSEPKWVRTGDIEEWLKALYPINPDSEGGDQGPWSGKIDVADPDPPPTIHTLLEAWTIASPVGVKADRSRFLKEHMSSSIDNILEILLRLIRGDRAIGSFHHQSHSSSSLSSPNAPHTPPQTHVSLAVLSIFRMTAEYAEKASEAHGRLEERIGDIVRALPQHLVYRSLDGIFREWSADMGLPYATIRKPTRGN